jgi:NADH pyrophosphatase NudC (nudix superfamily)
MRRERFRFCPSCGEDGLVSHNGRSYDCKKCGFVYYHNVAAATVAILRYGDELVLTLRKNEPYRGMFDLPGGFMEPGESFEEGVRREIEEELGIVDLPNLSYLFSIPNIYPYEGVVYHSADTYFVCDFDSKPDLRPADDVSDAVWMKIDDIDFDTIAFDSMKMAISLLKNR